MLIHSSFTQGVNDRVYDLRDYHDDCACIHVQHHHANDVADDYVDGDSHDAGADDDALFYAHDYDLWHFYGAYASAYAYILYDHDHVHALDEQHASDVDADHVYYDFDFDGYADQNQRLQSHDAH